MSPKLIDLGYRPRPIQAVIHKNIRRFNVLVCHRRFGKTILSRGELLDRGLQCPLYNPQYAYIAPTYGQAKRVMWEFLKDTCRKIPTAEINESELRIDIHRPDRGDKVRFILLGAENPDSLRGIYLDGVIFDEYAQCDPTIWGQIVRPALSDRHGWAIFIGTPKGQNHFYDIYTMAKNMELDGNKDWYTCVYRASQTRVVELDELEAARSVMSPEEYEQEYECSFQAALVGAYYGKYMQELEDKKQITKVPYDSSALVFTYWDLGISDTTAIWFIQEVGREFHVIDYVEMSGVGLDWYVKEIKNRPYVYEDHWIPHDGAARELGTGRTRQETLRELGLKTKIVPKQSVADGIHAVRTVLPRCWFDAIKCERGIAALKNYQRKFDHKAKMFLETPLHDWSSNGADAFRQFALTCRNGMGSRSKIQLPREAETSFNALG